MKAIQAGMDLWSSQTCIQIKKKILVTNFYKKNYFSSYWSYVGRIGKKQLLSLAAGCWGKGTVSHEIGKFEWTILEVIDIILIFLY